MSNNNPCVPPKIVFVSPFSLFYGELSTKNAKDDEP